MTIPAVVAGALIDPVWGNAVADAINDGLPTITSNANGYTAQFPSGLQVVWYYGTKSMTINTAYGALFQGTLSFTFPTAFVGPVPAVLTGQGQWGTGRSWCTVGSTSVTGTTITYLDAFSRASSSEIVSYAAVGLWK